MVTFLRKIFIKDYKNISNEDVRKKHGLLASFLGICFNTILFVSKLIMYKILLLTVICIIW